MGPDTNMTEAGRLSLRSVNSLHILKLDSNPYQQSY